MSKSNNIQPLNDKVAGSSSLVLTAVALQDHWARSLSLGTNCGPRKVGLGPAARTKQYHKVKSLIDTRRHKGKNKIEKTDYKEKEETEYVLDEKLPPLTLAQKFGLVYAPKPLLSEQDWNNVKAKSNQRDDSTEPCVICKEDFGVQEQVLLSCTHVFHRACLQALERFTGRKSCPMCRHEQYQTRVIQEGARIHKHKCATKIQSLWRGYIVRCWYRQLRDTTPPKDPMLRKKFFEEKLSAIVDRIIKSIDVNITEFMREIDCSVQESRAIFNQWDAMRNEISSDQWDAIQLKAVERGETDCPICLTELFLPDGLHGNSYITSASEYRNQDASSSQRKLNRSSCTVQNSTAGSKCNRKIQKSGQKIMNYPVRVSSLIGQNAKIKKLDKCTNSDVNLNCSASTSDHIEEAKFVRSTVLLSCTHVFHMTCLKTLEDIAMHDMKNTCPVCRAYYQKHVIVF